MQNGLPDEAALVRNAIEQGGRDDFAEVLAAVRRSGALDHARRVATAESQRAVEAIADLPASQYKDSLLQLSAFAVSRSF